MTRKNVKMVVALSCYVCDGKATDSIDKVHERFAGHPICL